MKYRNIIVKYSRIKIVILITLLAVFATIILYFFLSNVFNEKIAEAGIVMSIVIPSIIAPSISWYMIGLLLKLNNMEIEARRQVIFDSLTKVKSRQAFLEQAEDIHKLMIRDNLALAILYIDIDNFKKINDTYGHNAGDEVLKSFASLMKKHARQSDLLGRLGGEEFAFALPKTHTQGAIKFADNLRYLLKSNPFIQSNVIISYTISIGISILDDSNQVSLDELIIQADKALYTAKESSKDCTINYKQ